MHQETREALAYVQRQMRTERQKLEAKREDLQRDLDHTAGAIAELDRRLDAIDADLES